MAASFIIKQKVAVSWTNLAQNSQVQQISNPDDTQTTRCSQNDVPPTGTVVPRTVNLFHDRGHCENPYAIFPIEMN